jgi:hypothetical protein
VGTGEYVVRLNLATLRGSANNGCSLCAILEEGMSQMGLLCHPDVQNAQFELCITFIPGRSVIVTVYLGEPGSDSSEEVELEFYTEFGE